MQSNVARILITEQQLQLRVGELAREIVTSYGTIDGHLTILTILNGSIIFLADLIRRMPVMMRLELVTVSSYPGRTTESVGARLTREIAADVRGQDVLVVDDILDTGKTLRLVRQELLQRGPRSLKIATLLRKPSKAPPDVAVDFVGFDIEDEFVVGYGLDYDNHYRNLPYIAVLSKEAM